MPGHWVSARVSSGEGPACAGCTSASTTSRSRRGVVRHAMRNGVKSTRVLDGEEGAAYYRCSHISAFPKIPPSPRSLPEPGVPSRHDGAEAHVDIAELKRKSVAE